MLSALDLTNFPSQLLAPLQLWPFGLFSAVYTPFEPPVSLCDKYIMSSNWASSFHIASPNPRALDRLLIVWVDLK